MNFRSLDKGFETENVLTARVELPVADYPDDESRIGFYDGLIQRLVALPDVESVALADDLPGIGTGNWFFGIEGVAYTTDEDYAVAHRATITPAFFTTFGGDVQDGRDSGRPDKR